MQLVETYENYRKYNEEYIGFIEELVNNDFKNKSEDDVLEQLAEGKMKFELLMVRIGNYVLDEDQSENLQDFKYLLADSLFLSVDLINFYKLKEFERFKMRFTNYIRKKRLKDNMIIK